MSYATFEDMILRFERGDQELSRLTDSKNMPPSEIDTQAVQIALDDATREIESALAQIFQMPLLGCAVPGTKPIEYRPPSMLVRACCDIARYNLYDERPTEQVKELYKRAKDWLKALRDGKESLLCDAPPASTGGLAGVPLFAEPQHGGSVHASFEPRIFNRSTLSNFRSMGGMNNGSRGGYRS